MDESQNIMLSKNQTQKTMITIIWKDKCLENDFSVQKTKPLWQKADNGCLRLQVGEETSCKGVGRNFFRVRDSFYVLIVVVVPQLYIITKISQTVHLKWVNFIVCKQSIDFLKEHKVRKTVLCYTNKRKLKLNWAIIFLMDLAKIIPMMKGVNYHNISRK
jgi:hypothetical protein